MDAFVSLGMSELRFQMAGECRAAQFVPLEAVSAPKSAR